MTRHHDRRHFLTSTSAVAAATLLFADRALAADLSPAEQANVKLVNDFCATFAARDASKPLAMMADDAVYRVTETTPALTGREAIGARIKTYLENADRVDFKVLDTYAIGPMVINHRIDTFASATRPLVWEGVGVFFLKDGKIREWQDFTIKVTRTPTA